MPIITIRDIEDAYKDKQATQEWNQEEMQMEYQDFYDIADYLCMQDRKSTHLNSSHLEQSRMPSSA